MASQPHGRERRLVDRPFDHVTPYDRFARCELALTEALASGARQRELRGFFGASAHRALTALARRAHRTPLADGNLRVLIVPGIMGSQLGLERPPPLPPNVLWLDPIDIALGRLALLRVPRAAPIVPLGMVAFSYLRLQLELRARGFATEFHDYDWRLSVVDSGRALAARLRALRPARVALVAHSLGGLVSRAALALSGTEHVERVLLLGTPHGGSYSAAQAVRGTYAVVRKIACLTPRATAEQLATEVFATFPSVYDLLPAPQADGLDLLDARHWPARGPQPATPLLAAARTARAQLAAADERFHAIVGVGQPTVTAIAHRRGGFSYTVTRDGDGTVPVASALLAGARCYYTRVAHGELTRDPRIAAAVADLLERGTTRRLPDRWRGAGTARAQVSDAQLRGSHRAKLDWGALPLPARRRFLETLSEPPPLTLRVATRARAALRRTPARSPRARARPAVARGRRRDCP